MRSFEEFKKDVEDAIRKELPDVKEITFTSHNVVVDGKELLKDPSTSLQEEWTAFVENDGDYAEEVIMYTDIAILKIKGYPYWISNYGPEKRELRNRMN